MTKLFSLFKKKPAEKVGVSKEEQIKWNDRVTAKFLVLFFTATQAFPALAEPWDDWADAVLDALTNGFSRIIAIIVCIGLGYAAFMGKLSWKLAGAFMGGIVLIFGSAAIVDFFIDAV